MNIRHLNTLLLPALFCTLFSLSAASQNTQSNKVTDQEDFARQVEVPANIKIVEINHRSGNLKVVGWDNPFVRIEGTKQATAQTVDYARLINEEMEIAPYERIPNRLVLEFSQPPIEWRVSEEDITINYTAHVPRNLALDIRLDEGNIELEAVNNLVSIDHRAGDVTVNNINGRAQIRSQGGKVAINNISEDLKLDTQDSTINVNNVKKQFALRHKNGDVNLKNIGGKVILNTMNCNITMLQIDGRLDIDHRNGDITAEYFYDGVRIYLYDGQIRLAPHVAIPQNYYVVLDNGDVILRVPEESSMLAEIEVDSGSIHSDFQMPIWADKAISYSKGAINGGQNIVNISVKNGHVSLFKELGDVAPARQSASAGSSTQNTQQEEARTATSDSGNSLQGVEIP